MATRKAPPGPAVLRDHVLAAAFALRTATYAVDDYLLAVEQGERDDDTKLFDTLMERREDATSALFDALAAYEAATGPQP